MVLWVEKMKQVNKRKDDRRRKFKEKNIEEDRQYKLKKEE